jgi:hypothetical protein
MDADKYQMKEETREKDRHCRMTKTEYAMKNYIYPQWSSGSETTALSPYSHFGQGASNIRKYQETQILEGRVSRTISSLNPHVLTVRFLDRRSAETIFRLGTTVVP